MYIIENLIRRAGRMIGWEIGNAIENVIWSIAIFFFLMCCCLVSCGAVAWQIMFNK